VVIWATTASSVNVVKHSTRHIRPVKNAVGRELGYCTFRKKNKVKHIAYYHLM